jgi:hypothetical protein
VGRNKPFLPYHELAWTMLLSERDMLIVDLSSWAKELYRKADKSNSTDGFLRSLSPSDLNALSLRGDTEAADPALRPIVHVDGEPMDPGLDLLINEHVSDMNSDWRETAFDRLFPTAPDDVPSRADIEELSERLYNDFTPLRRDRNAHRAHKFERGKKADAAWLVPADVAVHFKRCQELVMDLRGLSSNYQFMHPNVRANPDEGEAQDVVDLVMCGSIMWIWHYGAGADSSPERPSYWQKRQEYYARRHAAHEALGDPAAPFNDRSRE